jgi:hypothetical protein
VPNRAFSLPDAKASGFFIARRLPMQVRITRPVVISTSAGLRHLAPGLVVELTDSEAEQVKRQKAGSSVGEVESEPEAAKGGKKKV